MKKIVGIIATLVSVIAFGETEYSIRIVNNQLAQQALMRGSGHPKYLQSGIVVTPDKLETSKPYCLTWGVSFSPNPQKIYAISQIKNSYSADVGYEIDLEINSGSTDPTVFFRIVCNSDTEALTIEDVKGALKDVYQILKP